MTISDMANVIMALGTIITTSITVYELWRRHSRQEGNQKEKAAPNNPAKDS